MTFRFAGLAVRVGALLAVPALLVGCGQPGTPAAPNAPAAPAAPAADPETPEEPTPTRTEASTRTLNRANNASEDVDCAKAKCVALTFDDGPGPDTGRLLDSLEAEQVPATFFVLGTHAARNPEMLKRMQRSGMEIGNHSWDHPQFTKLTAEQQREQIRRGSRAVTDAGVEKPTLFRPPYGAYNKATRGLGLPLILWNVDSEDWKNRDAKVTRANIKRDVRKGSIVLMHDIHSSSVDAVPGIVKDLKSRGYTLVTVTDLLGKPKAGHAYGGR